MMLRPLLASTVVLAPAVAAGCPYCAGREGAGAFGELWLLGAVIAAPFLVAGAAFIGVRYVLAEKNEAEAEAGAVARPRGGLAARPAAPPTDSTSNDEVTPQNPARADTRSEGLL